jgi:predicted metalloprotease with PDZ domain
MMMLALLTLSAAAAAPPRPITLEVDAREAPRRVFHARLTIPAPPGPLTLVYPKWIPGEHGPTGPIADLAGLKFNVDGKPVAWRRDPVEVFAFHLDVPAGADAVEASLDYLSPAESGKFSSGPAATSQLAVVSWNTLLFQPQGKTSDQLTYSASLLLPAGWRYGTALPVAKAAAERVEFAPASLTTLVDSPVLCGVHLRTVELGGTPQHRIHVAADSEAALAAPQAVVEAWKKLVAETGVLFGARHYRSYSFLLTLSDHTAHFGLEHHESSDNRVPERSLIDEDARRLEAGLLSHEMTHSWNGKYRRPAALMPGSFETPMQGDLLWVYEGLTTYLGQILAARSGLLTPDEYRESLALTAAAMDAQAGRAWRPTLDTAVSAQFLYDSRPDWASWRRGVDFYPEGELLWLDADTVIRRESRGARSLDDFCKAFHGGESGPPKVVSYTLADVVATLNKVAPYDWAGFLHERVDLVRERADVAGIEGGGWKLVYTDALPQMLKSREEHDKLIDARFSLGFVVKDTGEIPDVLPASPAGKAGLPPGVKLVAVNGRRFSKDVLRDAIRASSDQPIELLIENGEFFASYRLDYSGGPRYPHLVRDEARPDLLTAIVSPRS